MQTAYSKIYDYWNKNPCSGGNANFPFKLFKGFRVLEIGCGGGVDAERFVNAGAIYTGIDLTDKAVYLTRQRIGNKGTVQVMNAEYIDFPDNYFDLVYSFGVIHHSVNPNIVFKEIYRVLKPRGLIRVMLYNKPSVRYVLDIMFIRKILWLLRYPKYKYIRTLIPIPTKEQWISINTDTIGCPQTRVYTKKEALSFFYKYSNLKTFTSEFGWFRHIWGNK